MLVRVSFICILTLLSSCKNEIIPPVECVNIDVTSHIDISFEELMGSINLIQLEASAESYLPAEGKIWPSENGFFFNGNTQNLRDVYYFNEKGGFERKVGKVGKGPGEFMSCYNLIDLGDTIAIYDQTSKKFTFLLRNGSFVGETFLDYERVAAVTIHAKNRDIYMLTMARDFKVYRINRPSLEEVDSLFPNPSPASKKFMNNSFYPVGQGRMFYQDRHDYNLNVFEITDTIEHRYHIEAGMDLKGYQLLPPPRSWFREARQLRWSFWGILENPDWLYLYFKTTNFKKEPAVSDYDHLLVRRKDLQVYRLPGHRIDDDYMHPAFRLDNSNVLFLTINPDQMIEQEGWMEKCKQQNITFSLDQNPIVVKIDLDNLIALL